MFPSARGVLDQTTPAPRRMAKSTNPPRVSIRGNSQSTRSWSSWSRWLGGQSGDPWSPPQTTQPCSFPSSTAAPHNSPLRGQACNPFRSWFQRNFPGFYHNFSPPSPPDSLFSSCLAPALPSSEVFPLFSHSFMPSRGFFAAFWSLLGVRIQCS